MRWGVDDGSGTPWNRRRMTLQLALFALHLGSGATLLCKAIKAATIRQYLADVSTVLRRLDRDQRDFRRDSDSDTRLAPTITAVLKELERWEQMPNRREPFTLEMLSLLQQQAKLLSPDGILQALSDWFLLGLLLGLRRSEWAQSRSNVVLGTQQRNLFSDTQAFTINDFRFESATRQRFLGPAALTTDPTSLVKLFVKFRTQKNGSNGEERLVTASWSTNGDTNAIHAALSIIRRHQRLAAACPTTPLALFQHGKDVFHITDGAIEATMRALASHVYQLDTTKDKEALQRWSSHSLRVGACVILHSTGRNSTEIQHLLRWRSTAFMAYLRNTTLLADTQRESLQSVAANPAAI
jgi:hypothetical protein